MPALIVAIKIIMKIMQNKYFSKTIILTLIFSAVFPFFPIQTKKADAWDAMAAAVWEDTQRKLEYTVNGTLMGSLRQSAFSLLSREMDRFISGVSRNGVRLVTSWENYLIKNPTRNAQRYINDYISHALSGRGSSANYSSNGAVFGVSTIAMSNEGFGKGKEKVLGDEYSPIYYESYAEKMEDMLQEEVVEPEPWSLTYYDDPQNMFDSDNLANLNSYVIGDNMMVDGKMYTDAAYQQKLDEEKTIAAVEGTANQGFESEKTEDGYVLKPGILFKDAKANVENLPNLAITAATSIPELVAATVSRAISGLMESTIKGVERAIVREADMITNSAIKQTNNAVNQFGPGALYK